MPRRRAQRKPLDHAILRELVGYNVRRADLYMRQEFERNLGPGRFRPGEFSALALIGANPQVTQAELAHALGVRRPNMVGLIGRLERRGLVRRTADPQDRRNHALETTARGGALLRDTRKRVAAGDRRAAAALSERERTQLIGLLRRLHGVG
jgi:DNA-binding MarR family transcriptional regulator